MIKVEIEISTEMFEPEELDDKQAIFETIKIALSKEFGIRYNEINVTKIEIE